MKFVLTGASGPIGIALVNLLVHTDHSVIVLTSRNPSDFVVPLSDSITSYSCDLSSYNSLNPDFTADVFIHMAWVGGSSRDNIHINQDSMLASVDAVDLASQIGCHTFIGLGSQAEYGINQSILSHETACHPNTAFGAAKLSSMFNCSIRCSQLGLRFVWSRVFSVYGPFDRDTSLVTSTINNLILSRPLSFTRADNCWDFLHSQDAADAILLLALNSSATGIYPIASGISHPLKFFIDIICSKFNLASEPFVGLRGHSSACVSLRADISRLQSEFNWSPKIDFSAGIDALVDHQKQFLCYQ